MRKTNDLKQKSVEAQRLDAQKINCRCVGAVAPKSAHVTKAIQNKGITLIALIITIVVMLILVGVTINTAVNGGLFQQAGKAVSDTQNAINAEQTLASGEIKIGDSWYNSMDDYLNGIESVKSLQSKHKFLYYDSLVAAVTDVNDGTIDSTNTDKEGAVAGAYEENEKFTVVLLKDSKEATRVEPKVDMTINLGGKILSSDDQIGIDIIAGNITVDGRLKGSTIKIINNEIGMAVQIRPDSECFVNGGNYIVITKEGRNNGINNYGNAYLLNCDIRGYANSNYDGSVYGVGVNNRGVLTIDNCYIMGASVGINNYGDLNINGGTYEGFVDGGILFGGEETITLVKNAEIRQCAIPEGYTSTAESHNTGFEILEAINIKVYMDNCDIYGNNTPIYLSEIRNNSLFLSNSRINTDKQIKIEGTNNKLYIGKGCNFTAAHTTNPSAVVVTNEVYTQAN